MVFEREELRGKPSVWADKKAESWSVSERKQHASYARGKQKIDPFPNPQPYHITQHNTSSLGTERGR